MNARPQTTAPSPATPAHPRNPLIKIAMLMALLAAVSVVAYSIYIAVHEPDPQETVILGQTKMAAGSPTGVRILVRNRQTGRPVQGAKVVLTLSGKTNGIVQLGSFTTDASGSTAEAINIPAIPPGDYELIVDATSSGVPSRASGMRGMSVSVSGESIWVSISPGATALTRTPSWANSTAISRVSAESAAFEVE